MITRLFIIFINLALASCVTTPRFHSDDLTPADIVDNIKCELAQAIFIPPRPHLWLKDWNATLLLTLKVLKENDNTSSLTLAIPLNPGIATPGIDLGLLTRATRTADIQLYQDLALLKYETQCNLKRSRFLLTGNLGIRDWFDRIQNISENSVATNDISKYGAINYTIDFFIKKTFSPKATFTLIPIGRRAFGATPKVGLKAEFTHTLKVTLNKKIKKKKVKPTKVIIVGDTRLTEKRIELLLLQRRDATNRFGLAPSDAEKEKLDELDREIEKLIKKAEQQRQQAVKAAEAVRPPKDGISDAEKRGLDRALSRSLTNDIRGNLRELGLPE